MYRTLCAALRWIGALLGCIPVEEARVPLFDSENGSAYSDALDDSFTDGNDYDNDAASFVSDAATIRPTAHHQVDVGYSISAESSFSSFDSADGRSGEVGCGELGGSESTDEEDYVYLDTEPAGLWAF